MAIITVRMSDELHGRINGLAHDRRQSMNGLCVEVLEHAVATWDRRPPASGPDPDVIPIDTVLDQMNRQKPR